MYRIARALSVDFGALGTRVGAKGVEGAHVLGEFIEVTPVFGQSGAGVDVVELVATDDAPYPSRPVGSVPSSALAE